MTFGKQIEIKKKKTLKPQFKHIIYVLLDCPNMSYLHNLLVYETRNVCVSHIIVFYMKVNYCQQKKKIICKVYQNFIFLKDLLVS